MGRIKLTPRTESIVKIPIKPGSPLVGMTRKREVQEGVILAASLTKVVDGYEMTSILNVNDTEVDIQELLVELDEVDPVWDRGCGNEFESQDREREIITKLKLEHLNAEERKTLV